MEPNKSGISRRNMMAFSLCYFAFFGGLASLMPHLSVYLKQVGITASEMAVMGCVTPLLGLFTRPLFGALADKQKWHKHLAIICFLANGLFFSVMLFLPTRTSVQPSSIPTYQVQPNAISSSSCIDTAQLDKLNSSTACAIPLQMENCTVTCAPSNLTFYVSYVSDTCIYAEPYVSNGANVSDNGSDSTALVKCAFDCSSYSFPWQNDSISSANAGPPSYKCIAPEDRPQVKRSYRIEITASWMFFLWLLVRSTAYAFFHPCFNLQDAMVYSVIGDNRAMYGHVRSFGSIGFFIFALVTSAIVHSTSVNGQVIFWPVILIYDIMMIMSAACVVTYEIKDAQASRNLFKAIRGALHQVELSVMLIFLIFTGILNTSFEIYIFWHLYDLGGRSLLFGVMLAVNCFFELPCIILAGRLIARIGEIPCLYLVFFAYAVRLLVYSVIQNPWLCLLVEPLQGITMGIHLVAYTSYVARVTEKSALGSMQGLASGMHYGLGGCIGALAGGFTYDAFGPRVLYFGCACFAIASMILYVIIQTCFVKRSVKSDVSTTKSTANEKPIIISNGSDGKGNAQNGDHHDEEELKALTSENGHMEGTDAETKKNEAV